MRKSYVGLCAVVGIFLMAAALFQVAAAQASHPAAGLTLRPARLSPDDLEISGDLAGLPPGSIRYLTRQELLALPQVHYTVTDDSNFTKPAMVSGVPLEDLARRLGPSLKFPALVAICSDEYRAHYSSSYLAAHHPLLVLQVDGQPPAAWPKDPEGNAMGPYLISQPKFTPSFKVLSHSDEAQIPWGIVRLDFRSERAVFSAIAPQGPQAKDAAVQAGFRIAQQNCFRCHNMDEAGGQKAGVSWTVIAAFAESAPEGFAAYVRKPQAVNPRSQMEGSPNYDDATIAALEAYFATFLP